MQAKLTHPLTPGVTVVVTRHVGPYKAALRGRWSLHEAAARSGERDRRAALARARKEG